MTSSQTREKWMNKIIYDHPIRCVNAFRMGQKIFLKLVKIYVQSMD